MHTLRTIFCILLCSATVAGCAYDVGGEDKDVDGTIAQDAQPLSSCTVKGSGGSTWGEDLLELCVTGSANGGYISVYKYTGSFTSYGTLYLYTKDGDLRGILDMSPGVDGAGFGSKPPGIYFALYQATSPSGLAWSGEMQN
jgi:hypothetical protein